MVSAPGEWRKYFRDCPPQPGDEVVGAWSRDQLMRMDARFCERLQHAIASGEEHTPKGRVADMNAPHFTEQQITLLRELAAPLAPSQRSAFLKDVARRLHNVELGDGAVAQAAREAQAAIRKAALWLQA